MIGYRGGFKRYHEAVRVLTKRGVYRSAMEERSPVANTDRMLNPFLEGRYVDVYYEWDSEQRAYILTKDTETEVFVSMFYGPLYPRMGDSGLTTIKVDGYGAVTTETLRKKRGERIYVKCKGRQDKLLFRS